MSFFSTKLSPLPCTNTTLKFMPYTPKLPGPKPTKAKRNARKPACPLESGDTKLLDICAEAGDIAVGLKPAIGLSHPPSSKSFILSDATTIYVAGNDEGIVDMIVLHHIRVSTDAKLPTQSFVPKLLLVSNRTLTKTKPRTKSPPCRRVCTP